MDLLLAFLTELTRKVIKWMRYNKSAEIKCKKLYETLGLRPKIFNKILFTHEQPIYIVAETHNTASNKRALCFSLK